ncbi:MAG: glycine-rich protein A3-like [Deltaproteobacteria bacterium]|nr:glycine-rich protein A3-like [Deltaproteobacteria bacterium]
MKPSPIASILLFIGAALLLFAAVSGSWVSMRGGDYSFSFGLIRGESCFEGTCRSESIFSGGGGAFNLISLLEFVLVLGSAVLGVITAIKLFRPFRSVLAVVTMSIVAAALLFGLFFLFRTGGSSLAYGAGVFFAGGAATLAGSIMGMTRPRPPQAMRPMMMRPPMGMYPPQQGYPPPGYAPPGYAPQGYAPQGYAPPPQGYAPQGYAPQGYAPQPSQPPQQQMYQPPQQPQQGAPCPTCATPSTWVAQYGRMFCAPCNKYL